MHFFELLVAMLLATIILQFGAHRLGLPPAVALLVGGILLAFLPGLPVVTLDPELVLVIFLPPLLMDGARSIAIHSLHRNMIGVLSLAVGAVVFTTVVVALVVRLLMPSLPWAACAALGAIVAPPDAISARALLQRVNLPRRLAILLEGESLFNDASGLVLFRFAVAAGVTGAFSASGAVGSFFILAIGGMVVGILVSTAWVLLVRRLEDEYLMIAASVLAPWVAYLLAEAFHVSGVIATVTAGLICGWYQHVIFSPAVRMRGTSFWAVMIFLLEATVFMLIGSSLRGIIERVGGFEVVFENMAVPILVVLAALTAARFAWIFGSTGIVQVLRAAGLTRYEPMGIGSMTVLGWAGMRGVVTLAVALSVPADFPGRDFMLVMAFAVILGTVLLQGMTLGPLIRFANLDEATSDHPRLSLAQAQTLMGPGAGITDRGAS